jgi:hypothetical protein
MRAPFHPVPLALAILSLSACSPRDESEPTPHTYELGAHVPLGQLTYTVFDRQWLAQIGEGVGARIPQNRFYEVRISVLNGGSASSIIHTIDLVDDAGTAYHEIENGDGVPEFMGALREVAPAETAQGYLVFDVQPKHYKLKLSDAEEKNFAMIDLPLSFDTAAPDVTTPLDSIRSDTTKK